MKTESTRSKNALLAVVCLAQFMVILDVAIVNVALPSMRSGLHFSTTGLQWVVNAYTLTFAGFLMLGGRSADLLGRRRVFLVGTALFALASLGCALADSRALLIGARAVQGISGAVLSPATLAIITSSFAEGRERNRGLAAWGAVGGLGASSGALLGGILTQTLGWQAIFAVNVPLGFIVVLLGIAPDPGVGARGGHAPFRPDRRRARHRQPRQPDVRDRPDRHARLGCFGRARAAGQRVGAARRVPVWSRRDLHASRSCRCRSSASAICVPRTRSCCCCTRPSSPPGSS